MAHRATKVPASPFPADHARRRQRAGFTMIELMVVMGVIVVLIAVAAVGYRHLATGGQENQTKVTLELLKNMLGAYERDAGLSGLPLPTGDQSSLAPQRGNDNDMVAAVRLTSAALKTISRVPINKQSFGQLPSKSLRKPAEFEVKNDGSARTLRDLPQDPPLAVDGWRNLIMYVPKEGLTKVQVAGTELPILKAPDSRPFFASPGPDGDFRTGDDNIYSFNQ